MDREIYRQVDFQLSLFYNSLIHIVVRHTDLRNSNTGDQQGPLGVATADNLVDGSLKRSLYMQSRLSRWATTYEAHCWP